MSPTDVNVLSALGGILAAVLTFWGVRLSQRQSAKAQEATQEIEHAKVDAAAYGEARQIWDTLIEDLRNKAADQTREIDRLRREFEAQQAQTDRWRERLEDLEQKRAGDRKAIHLLTEYVRDLLDVIEKNDLIPPKPPEGLELER